MYSFFLRKKKNENKKISLLKRKYISYHISYVDINILKGDKKKLFELFLVKGEISIIIHLTFFSYAFISICKIYLYNF